MEKLAKISEMEPIKGPPGWHHPIMLLHAPSGARYLDAGEQYFLMDWPKHWINVGIEVHGPSLEP